MNEKTSGPNGVEIAVYVVVVLGAAWLIWKVSVDGFYQSEVPVIGVVAAVTAVAGLVASRMTSARKKAEAAAADRAQGVE